MSLLINLTDVSADLEAYIDDYVASTASLGTGRYGTFNPSTAPYDQWVQGTNTSDYAAVLDGDFTSYTGGNLTGTAYELNFGYGLTTSGGLSSVTDVELTFDFRNLNVDAGPDSFDYLVYGLISGDASRVYDYFDDAGTIQVGTSADNSLYGYASTDYFFFSGASGNDTIYNFTDGQDYIVIDADDYADWSAFSAVATVSGNTVSWAGNEITLDSFSGTLSSADFQFVADASTIA